MEIRLRWRWWMEFKANRQHFLLIWRSCVAAWQCWSWERSCWSHWLWRTWSPWSHSFWTKKGHDGLVFSVISSCSMNFKLHQLQWIFCFLTVQGSLVSFSQSLLQRWNLLMQWIEIGRRWRCCRILETLWRTHQTKSGKKRSEYTNEQTPLLMKIYLIWLRVKMFPY